MLPRDITLEDIQTEPVSNFCRMSAPAGVPDVIDLECLATPHSIVSFWVPTPSERKLIADGHDIKLSVAGAGMPPVRLEVTEYTTSD